MARKNYPDEFKRDAVALYRSLRAEQTKLNTEREILRKAAKYFAGETNW